MGVAAEENLADLAKNLATFRWNLAKLSNNPANAELESEKVIIMRES